MNLIEQLLEQHIGGLIDNLARARQQEKANPRWRSGNGETIYEVMTGYLNSLTEAQNVLANYKESV